MKFGRYKNFAWDRALKRRRETLLGLGTWKVRPPDALIDLNVRLYLEAYHRGPWRAIWKLIRHELQSAWMHYGWFKWEWIRVKVFRRPQDEILKEAERSWAEMEEVERVSSQL